MNPKLTSTTTKKHLLTKQREGVGEGWGACREGRDGGGRARDREGGGPGRRARRARSRAATVRSRAATVWSRAAAVRLRAGGGGGGEGTGVLGLAARRQGVGEQARGGERRT